MQQYNVNLREVKKKSTKEANRTLGERLAAAG